MLMWRGQDECLAVIQRQCESGNATMKVTVCFNGVRVVVPCGDGNGSVQDLMLQAASRYKKATGKPADCWVAVRSLQSSDGGLLDPDDRVADVADDREQIVAVFEERDGRVGLYRGGDGTSASSDGTRSPVHFTNGGPYPGFCRVDVEVTGDQEPGCLLQVRRGSEPTLSQVGAALPELAPPPLRSDSSKRWSAAPIIDDDIQASSTPIKNTSLEQLAPPGEREEASGDEREPSAFSRFARDSSRRSMQFGGNGDVMWRWADAAGQLQDSEPEPRRWEPVGANPSPDGSGDDGEAPPHQHQRPARLVVLSDVSGPLGMHVVPDCDAGGRDSGLLVQRVEPGSAVQRDGRVTVGDRIVQINGHSLRNISFQRAQEIFLGAMSGGRLRLVVEPAAESPQSLPGGSRVATVMPTKKPVPASLSSRTQSAIQSCNPRRPGRRLSVTLLKGAAGLGFSVTTRDNPAAGAAPVYVKNILPQGAAVEDGRLRPGDRLLEIDGEPMAGLSQQQVVQTLRAVPAGHAVQLVLSRQEQDEPPATSTAPATAGQGKKEEASPRLPRPLPPEQRELESESEPSHDKEILVFDIPVHDSERAGLGISVKGKTTAGRSGPLDVGIYIKSVIHGGAASKDGRLRRNDQLIDVNLSPLLGLSNSDAMETLRRAMCQEGPKPGVITLTVARRPSELPAASGRDSVASMLSNSSGELLAGWRSGELSGLSEESQVTVVARQPPPVPARPDRTPPAGRANIRNDSYYRATHDTWDASALQQHLDSPGSAGGGAARPQATDRPAPAADCAYASQTSLDHAGVGFTRDQLGRQSMSEKRHASKDAKATDTYQRTKRAREEREEQRRLVSAQLTCHATGELGPSLGLKKSSSLESLQTMVHELALAEDGESRGAGRGRGCNESFRAAVDRSYDAPLGAVRDRMETLALSAELGFVACLVDEEAGGPAAFSRELAARQSSMSSGVVEDKKAKRRSGLLKGLGSMFRFGRQRRPEERGPPDPIPPVRTTSTGEQRPRPTHAPPSQGEPAGQERAPGRAERMAQLRQEHQRRHAGRHGVYVTEAAEERAERQLTQVGPDKPVHLSDQINNNLPVAEFVRGAQGARSSEYFRNPRPAPISVPADRQRGAAGPPPHSWLGEDGLGGGPGPSPPRSQPTGQRKLSSGLAGETGEPRGHRDRPQPAPADSRAIPQGPPHPHSNPDSRGAQGRANSRAYPSGPADPRAHPSGPSDPRAYPSGPSDPRAYPSGPSDPRAYPGNHLDPRGYPMKHSESRSHPSSHSDHRIHSSGQSDRRALCSVQWAGVSQAGGPWEYRGAAGGQGRRPSASQVPPLGRQRTEPEILRTAAGDSQYGHYANYEQIRHHLRHQQQYHSQRGRHADSSVPARPVSSYWDPEPTPRPEHSSLPRHHERSRSGPAAGAGVASGGVGVAAVSGERARPAPPGLSQQWRALPRPSTAGSRV